MDKSEILPGEPIRILMCFRVKEGINKTYVIAGYEEIFSEEYVPCVWVSDATGKTIPSRLKPINPPDWGRIQIQQSEVSPGKKYLLALELHRWCATDLPPGKYDVHLDRLKIQYKIQGHDWDYKNEQFLPVPSTLSFKVLEPDNAALEAYYQRVYERAKNYKNTIPWNEQSKVRFDISLLLHAYNPVAAKYQYKYFYLENGYWEQWFDTRLANGFMGIPSMETAENMGSYYELHYKGGCELSGICLVIKTYARCADEKVRAWAEVFLNNHPEIIEKHPVDKLNWCVDYVGYGVISEFLALPLDAGCAIPK